MPGEPQVIVPTYAGDIYRDQPFPSGDISRTGVDPYDRPSAMGSPGLPSDYFPYSPPPQSNNPNLNFSAQPSVTIPAGPIPAAQALLFGNQQQQQTGSYGVPLQPFNQPDQAPNLYGAPPVTVMAPGQEQDLSGAAPVMVSPPGSLPATAVPQQQQPGLLQLLARAFGNIGGAIGGTVAGAARGVGGALARPQQQASTYDPTTANAFASMYGYGAGPISGIGPLDTGGSEFAQISNIPSGAFGSIGAQNAFGGGGRRVFIS